MGARRPTAGAPVKSRLVPPPDLGALLRRCHDRLHGRGAAPADEDLAMDMVRLLLAKALDEELPGELCAFRCAPAEAATEAGRAQAAARVHALFDEVKRRSPDDFGPDERITVGAAAIADVVAELQAWRLAGAGDLAGDAYEEYTAVHLKRQRGQFFTNRLVVDLMVELVDPRPGEAVLDPAGGSGRFLTAVARRRRAGGLFLVETSPRLVKVARAAMILGGAPALVTRGDGLGPYERLDPRLGRACPRGGAGVILTNPPFAGIGAGRVADPEVLRAFACGRRWAGLRPTAEPLREGAPPELLFFERCLDWLAPGGRLGIVLPKSFLDTRTHLPGRALLFERARLCAVVSCHRHTFQPHTGVRTCIVVAEKLPPGRRPPRSYPIFMAVSRRIGQDSEGRPVYLREAGNRPTAALDHDLGAILEAWRDFAAGRLAPAEDRFAVDRAALDGALRINPQAFLPGLNRTRRRVAARGGVAGWRVAPLGQIEPGAAVFKGVRLKTESLLADGPGPGIEPYYTPSAILQENADGLKWLDVARASPAQRRVIEAIRVRRGDILITRSGSVGRVAWVGARLDGAIVSDDMIRVRIADERRRLYALRYLQSRAAQDQMLLGEYGAIQQHLEPEHVAALLVPLPDDWARLEPVIAATRRALALREELAAANEASRAALRRVLGLEEA
jgi:hypothetical protein